MKKQTPKPRPSPLLWILPLLGILLGGGFALATAPRYKAPPAADEARLRERAVEYYKASRLFDYAHLARMFSPANQQLNTEEVQRQVAKFGGQFPGFDALTQKNLRDAAAGIKPELLELTVDGDWARTGGKGEYPVEDQTVQIPLNDVVWVRTAGDWWVYQLLNPEIQYYGLPPEEIRTYLLQQDEEFEYDQLPRTPDEVPKEGDERYDPRNAMSEEEAKRLLEENRKRQKQGKAGQAAGGEDAGEDAGKDNADDKSAGDGA